MLDVVLEWAVVLLPAILSIGGVFVSIKAPQSKHHTVWRAGLIAVGIVMSVITFWQQLRSRTAHIAELNALNLKLTKMERTMKTVEGGQQAEITRRQQAERDLAIIVQSTGKSVRDGVVSDLSQSARPSAELRNIQKELGALVNVGRKVMESCEGGPSEKCKKDRKEWEGSVEKVLTSYKNDPSGVARWTTWAAQNQDGAPLEGVRQEALLLSALIGQLK
jgi:hypothetical protein